MKDDNQTIKELNKKIEDLAVKIEKMKIAEYVDLLHSPRRLLLVNFMAGLARGLGIAVGFTILGAILIYFLQRLVVLNLPLIGDFIAEIIKVVNQQMGTGVR
ncbi:hypothetical protein GGQ84_001825 [Desulfitispora alkaliphila]|uniref:DUF5665 domain-containing protein n=1 Tax=Desulfitispora alkaliphila TaxID=622674 RepID=UPI003D1A491B